MCKIQWTLTITPSRIGLLITIFTFRLQLAQYFLLHNFSFVGDVDYVFHFSMSLL